MTLDLWPWKLIGFQTLLRTKYVPSLVKIHWKMLILECSQGYYAVKIWPGNLDLWPWKSIGFQILLRTKYVPNLVKIHWRMLILECSQGCDGRTDVGVTISLRWQGDNKKFQSFIENQNTINHILFFRILMLECYIYRCRYKGEIPHLQGGVQ